MTENVSDLVLEGNAAVTLLQELFACDITVARTQCEASGSIEGVGSLRPYAAPMGVVLRCSHAMAFSCGQPIHRMVDGSK